ncbi:MAG: acyl-CoA carboxylase subunit beta [Paludibacteraceae bacterium]|nr:acyl-CoA carboxylase subunit beta [Paludibacteraceae bacterium]
MKEKITELESRRKKALMCGGEAAIEKRHAKGLLTARERIDLLVDADSFHETDMFVHKDGDDAPGDGVVCGVAKINGKNVCVFAQDFTVLGGSLGLRHARKITKIQDLAAKMRCPIIGINDSGGARIQDGVDSLCGYGEIFYRNTLLSGLVPQISVVMGPCAGGAAYSPALTDFVFMVDGISKMFLTGPTVVETVMGETISQEDLGGARVHAEKAGTAHFFAENEKDCLAQVRCLLEYLPQSADDIEFENGARSRVSTDDFSDNIASILPSDGKEPYDVREVVKCVADKDSFLEVHEMFAPNIVCGFIRMDGATVGVVANQPNYLAGALDADSADKASRFIRFCDSFNIPLLTLMDVPGCLPGVDGEHSGAVRHGAKLFYAYAEATIPMITVVLRKAYGGGYVALGSRHIGADYVFCLPTAEIAVMGPESAVSVLYHKEIKSIVEAGGDVEAFKKEKAEEYRREYANPYEAGAKGYIDDVVDPKDVRSRVIDAFVSLKGKKVERPNKKHGLTPA